MFIINCSWILKTGWVVVRNFLDQKTRNKIQILGNKYQDQLLKYVDKENLPDFFGGTCHCTGGCLFDNAGPWKEYYDKFPNDNDPNDFTMPEGPGNLT